MTKILGEKLSLCVYYRGRKTILNKTRNPEIINEKMDILLHMNVFNCRMKQIP